MLRRVRRWIGRREGYVKSYWKIGRVIVVDEADKAAEHVVAIFRSLAGQGELTLADGRRVRRHKERENDVVVHPNFRLILLANRPGYRK